MSSYENPSITDALIIALVGFATVFVVLIVLMGIIALISKLFGGKTAPADEPEAVSAAPETVVAASEAERTKDNYTGVKLHGIDDKTAAVLMAIVAHKLNKPLDNLRFISVREVK